MAAKRKNSRKDSSNSLYDIIIYVSLILIVFSLFFIGFSMTGKVVDTDSAIVNVTISSTTAINFTTNLLNLGSGTVNVGSAAATIDSDGNVAGGTGWGNTGNLTLENIGNTNVSLDISFGKSAAEYIGGTSPEYYFKFNNKEAGSCTPASGKSLDSWIATTKTNTTICSSFSFEDNKDEINIGIKLVIPSDSIAGTRSDVVTATATTV